MRFEVLGALEVTKPDGPVTLSAPKQRLLLAILLCQLHRPISADRLIALLWDEPPDQARKALAWHVMKLRNALGDRDRVRWQHHGYLLSVEPGETDAERFQSLCRDGTAALTSGDHAKAHDLLTESLSLWRGPAYGELTDEPGVRDHARKLEELRLAATERRIEAGLELGHHGELVTELMTMVTQHPFRESLRAHLMLALYRTGRQADALETFRQGRASLVAELGIEPGARLQRLHERILGCDPDLELPPAPTPEPTTAPANPAPAQLPSAIATFTGRHSEIAAIFDKIDAATGRHALGVCSIDGMAGAGKTTLTIHIAQQLASRFPDGQLFIDLHGFSGDIPPANPSDAINRMLRALGVPASQIPGELDDRAALYRSTLAGRRMLILLDNAAGEEQVRPLLPGSPDCLVMITSRRRLIGLEDAQHLSVGELDRGEAIELFGQVAGPDRIVDEPPELVGDIVELCGRLPLTVRIAASRLLHREHWSVRDLWSRLSDEDRRLTELGVGDRNITAAFEMSYQELETAQRRMFRRLGQCPGPDFDLATVAAAAGKSQSAAQQLLDDLVDVHLLQSTGRHRYAFHDLLRVYARERGVAEDTAADRDLTTDRIFEWFARSAHAASIAMRPHRQVMAMPSPRTDIAAMSFADSDAALDWFTVEEHNLSAVINGAKRHRHGQAAWLIVDAMRGFLFRRTDRPTWRYFAEIGLAAAQQHNDRAAESAMRHSLGLAAALQGEYASAVSHYDRGVALTVKTGDERRRVELLLCLAGVHSQTGNHHATNECAQRALQLTRTHDNLMLPDTLHMLGVTCWVSGKLTQAAAHLREAVHLHRHYGHDNLDDTLSTLSIVYTELGELSAAESCARESLAVAGSLGSVHSQASALENLAGVYIERRYTEQAAAYATQAMNLATEAKLDKHEVLASLSLAMARLPQQPQQAAALLHRCLAMARGLDMTLTQIEALTVLSDTDLYRGAPQTALANANEAVRIARDAGLTLAEGKAMTALAAAQSAIDDRDTAISTAEAALEIHRVTEHRLGEARTHMVLAELHRTHHHFDVAAEHDALSRQICHDVGVPPPKHVAEPRSL